MLIVMASMERELAGVRRRMGRGWRPSGLVRLPGMKEAMPLDLRVIGMGKQAGPGLRSILENSNGHSNRGPHRTVGLLLLGVAGAVGPGLQTGDLVLSSRYYSPRLVQNSSFVPLREEALDPANHNEIPTTPQDRQDRTGGRANFLIPDSRLWQWAAAAGKHMERPVVYADSLTVSGLVTSPEVKKAIGCRYPVGIVNMEDYWAASVAQEVGVPFISARAVLDPVHQAMPAYLSGMAVSPAGALARLIAMPWRIPALAGLWRQLGIAQRALTDFAVNFLAQVSDAVPALSCETAETAVGAVPVLDRSIRR